MKKLPVFVLCLAAVLVLGFTVLAAGTAGTPEDPLITKSYLDQVVQPQMEKLFREQVAEVAAELQTTEAGRFSALRLSKGQVITGIPGTQLLLRSGKAIAAVSGDDTALVDSTDAVELQHNTALAVNHLCLVTSESGGIIAMEDDTVVLVSGSFLLH